MGQRPLKKRVMGLCGTGLGLAVVWNTVEDHEGKIVVKSSEKGTLAGRPTNRY